MKRILANNLQPDKVQMALDEREDLGANLCFVQKCSKKITNLCNECQSYYLCGCLKNNYRYGVLNVHERPRELEPWNLIVVFLYINDQQPQPWSVNFCISFYLRSYEFYNPPPSLYLHATKVMLRCKTNLNKNLFPSGVGNFE